MLWAKCSDTNEAEEALSIRALATIHEPLEDFMRTRQVISNELCLLLTAAAENREFVLHAPLTFGGAASIGDSFGGTVLTDGWLQG